MFSDIFICLQQDRGSFMYNQNKWEKRIAFEKSKAYVLFHTTSPPYCKQSKLLPLHNISDTQTSKWVRVLILKWCRKNRKYLAMAAVLGGYIFWDPKIRSVRAIFYGTGRTAPSADSGGAIIYSICHLKQEWPSNGRTDWKLPSDRGYYRNHEGSASQDESQKLGRTKRLSLVLQPATCVSQP